MEELGKVIDQANEQALGVLLSGEPVLVDVVLATDVINVLKEKIILHAGPPIEWKRMCGPMRGAICGIAVFEGWASNLSEAEKLASQESLEFAPNHRFGCVGPMTGMTTASQPLIVVENQHYGNRAYCTINEGLGKVMRFGGNDQTVLERLGWIKNELAPLLGQALRRAGGIKLKPLIARGLTMGDEMHQRNVACSSLLLRELVPHMAAVAPETETLARACSFIASNDQFFLNVAMAAGKALTDPAYGIKGSSMITAMSRNGTDFGIRVSSTGDRWFTAPVEMPQGLYFPGYSESDANPDMGDSAIVETIGLGGFAMGAAPAVAGFVGAGAASQAGQYTKNMAEITLGENKSWTIPAMDYLGVPTGIDIRRVVESNTSPTINTGIAHKEPGIGQVGAGVAKAPMACFQKALRVFAEQMGVK